MLEDGIVESLKVEMWKVGKQENLKLERWRRGKRERWKSGKVKKKWKCRNVER